MRKVICTLLLLTALSALSAQTIEMSYRFQKPQIMQVGTQSVLKMHDTRNAGVTGEPTLPYRAVKLCLPPGQTLDRVEVSYHNVETLSAAVTLCPVQPPRPLDQEGPFQAVMKQSVYASDRPYPASASTQPTVQYLHGAAFVLTTVTPVSYTPATGQVSWAGDVTVKIYTKSGGSTAPFTSTLPASDAAFGRIAAFAQNPDMLTAYARASHDADDYPLLIIAPDDNFRTTLTPLQAFYQARGIKSQIVTLAEVQSSASGDDVQDQMRNYIRSAVTDNAVETVILAGDAELMPYRQFHTNVSFWDGSQYTYYYNAPFPIASDLYFSALDGNWNTDGDAYWGEPANDSGQVAEDDLLPEVAVGRLPFSNIEDLSRILHKTMSYQSSPVAGELTRLVLAGEKMWDDPLTYSDAYLEQYIGQHDDNGYTTEGIPATHDIQKLYEHNEAWGGNEIMALLNQGGTAVYHSGHSNYFYNMQLSASQITAENFSQLNGTDHNYILVNTQGCQAGGFHKSDCIGEMMVTNENFAYAYIGGSENGWFNEGQTEGPSHHLVREFISAVYGDRIGFIGEAHMMSKLETAPWVDPYNRPTGQTEHEPGAQRWVFYAVNLLGDPALCMWTEEPSPFSVNASGYLKVDASGFAISVTQGQTPVPGCYCAIVQNDEIKGYGRTDDNGNAQIDLSQAEMSYDATQLIVSGYNGYTVTQDIIMTAVDETVQQPRALSLLGNYPNPFNPSTAIAYETAMVTDIHLTIHDISGRLVCTLHDGQVTAGRHESRWDGTDQSGTPVASGLYLARLESRHGTQVIKINLMK